MSDKISKDLKDPQLFISKDARKLYDDFKAEREEFKQMDNKDFFMLALVFGYLNKRKKKLENKDKTESGFFRLRNLTEEEAGLLKAIAITESKDIGVINDIVQLITISEEYANGGISHLKEFVIEDQASFIKNFASEIKKIAK